MNAAATKKWVLEPSLPITPQIYRILRERIIENDLIPGDRVSETDIAVAYGVSRQPIREAFIKLSDQGLLVVRPQRGTFISKINYVSVLDARFLREAIEADIVQILAADPDPALIKELESQVSAQNKCSESDPEAFIHLDELFHQTLAEAAGKSGTWTQIEGMKTQMDRARYLSLSQFPVANLVQQHASIVASIREQNVAKANFAIRTHLREVLKDLPQILVANPHFFELPEGNIPEPVNTPIQQGGNYET
jgi:DNA-binding GntR family transcriptional regulator